MAEIRHIRESDLPQLYYLSTLAGWNQTREDWRRMLIIEASGCFCIEDGSRIASTATAIRYGKDLAWIGMVLTHPDYRGRGHATRLVGHALEYLEKNGVACAKLDATELGEPIYSKLGFIADYPVERWIRRAEPRQPPDVKLEPFELRDWAAMDREVFGVDRSRLLNILSSHDAFALPGKGFSLGRAGRIATYFGPCVATDSDAARILLMNLLARHPEEPVMWDLIPAHRDTTRLARAFGFEPLRFLTRMRRGGEYTPPSPSIVALAGLEFG